MRNWQVLLMFILITNCSCKGPNQCIEFERLEWCFEGDVTINQGKVLNVTNERDGLPFDADISFISGKTESLKKFENNKDLNQYQKGDIVFYSLGERENALKVSAGKIVSGSLIGFAEKGQYIINYRGVNRNKVNRYLELMME